MDTVTVGCSPNCLPTRGSGGAHAAGGTGAQKKMDIQRLRLFELGKEGTSRKRTWWLELPFLQITQLSMKAINSQMPLSQRADVYTVPPTPYGTCIVAKGTSMEDLTLLNLTLLNLSGLQTLVQHCLTGISWSASSFPHTLWASPMVPPAGPRGCKYVCDDSSKSWGLVGYAAGTVLICWVMIALQALLRWASWEAWSLSLLWRWRNHAHSHWRWPKLWPPKGPQPHPDTQNPPSRDSRNQKLRDLSSFKLQFNFKTFEDFGLYLILEFNFFELYSVKGFKHWTLMSPREIHNGSEFSLNLGLLCVGILLLVYFYAAIYFHSNSDEPYCATWQFIIWDGRWNRELFSSLGIEWLWSKFKCLVLLCFWPSGNQTCF